MRLWSVHPKYLDRQGLLALWREGLLALAVVRGRTRGYRSHPQLNRFLAAGHPDRLLRTYLGFIFQEARQRGYRFDLNKLRGAKSNPRQKLKLARGQFQYELRHLLAKLEKRNPELGARLIRLTRPIPHPIFRLVPGPIAGWEKLAR